MPEVRLIQIVSVDQKLQNREMETGRLYIGSMWNNTQFALCKIAHMGFRMRSVFEKKFRLTIRFWIYYYLSLIAIMILI